MPRLLCFGICSESGPLRSLTQEWCYLPMDLPTDIQPPLISVAANQKWCLDSCSKCAVCIRYPKGRSHVKAAGAFVSPWNFVFGSLVDQVFAPWCVGGGNLNEFPNENLREVD